MDKNELIELLKDGYELLIFEVDPQQRGIPCKLCGKVYLACAKGRRSLLNHYENVHGVFVEEIKNGIHESKEG